MDDRFRVDVTFAWCPVCGMMLPQASATCEGTDDAQHDPMPVLQHPVGVWTAYEGPSDARGGNYSD